MMGNQAACEAGNQVQRTIVQGRKLELPPGAILVRQNEVMELVETAMKTGHQKLYLSKSC